MTAGWSSGLRSRLQNQRSRVQDPLVSKGFCNELLPLLMSRGCLYILHTYHSRFIPEGVAEVSQIFLRDTHVLPKLLSYDEHCVIGGKSIAVLLQSISGVIAINLMACLLYKTNVFMLSMLDKKINRRCRQYN
jgi:hypothetical protein